MPKFDVILRNWEGDQTTGKVRHVNVPDNEWKHAETLESKLETIFMFGQNDMQSQNKRSVSVGDVIKLEGNEYVVKNTGFGTEFTDIPAPIPFLGDEFPKIREGRDDLDFKDQDAVQTEKERFQKLESEEKGKELCLSHGCYNKAKHGSFCDEHWKSMPSDEGREEPNEPEGNIGQYPW
jgi:hypothetical protein